jgi:hypothetical protein
MPATQPEDGRSDTASADPTPGDAVDQIPLAVTHAEMNAAYDSGEAVPLGQSVSWLVRYRNAWWVVYERGWLRIADDLTAADLDQAAARLAQAEAGAIRDIDLRSTPTPHNAVPGEPRAENK